MYTWKPFYSELIRAILPYRNRQAELIQILAMEPMSISYRTRPFVDERFIAWLLVAQ